MERTNEIVKLLTDNKYLFLFQGDIQSVVTGYKIGETVTIFTRTLEWLLTKFVVPDFSVQKLMDEIYNPTWTVSNLCKYIITEYLPESVGLEFKGISQDESNVENFVSEKATDMYSAIKSILSDKKYGFRFFVDLDNKKFVFSIFEACENNDIILCDEYKTSYESEYSFDIQKEIKGGAFYHSVKNMGKWSAYYNEPNLSLTPENYGKYYTVTDSGQFMGMSLQAGDIILCKEKSGAFTVVEKAEPFLEIIPSNDDGIFSWSGILTSGDEENAKKEVENTHILDMLTCKTRLSYLQDFNLGDIIKVDFFVEGVSFRKNKLISEIHLWDEVNDTGAMPTTIDI